MASLPVISSQICKVLQYDQFCSLQCSFSLLAYLSLFSFSLCSGKERPKQAHCGTVKMTAML